MKEYRLTIGSRTFIYTHEPDFLIALDVLEKYPVACLKCVEHMDINSAKVRKYIATGAEDKRNKANERFTSWESMLDKALNGKPSQFFVKLNDLL